MLKQSLYRLELYVVLNCCISLKALLADGSFSSVQSYLYIAGSQQKSCHGSLHRMFMVPLNCLWVERKTKTLATPGFRMNYKNTVYFLLLWFSAATKKILVMSRNPQLWMETLQSYREKPPNPPVSSDSTVIGDTWLNITWIKWTVPT